MLINTAGKTHIPAMGDRNDWFLRDVNGPFYPSIGDKSTPETN
jgi:hypothetical protein